MRTQVNRTIKLLQELPKRIKVVLTNLLTYLLLAQTMLTIVVAQGELFDSEVVQYATLGLSLVGAVIVFIRRVTPVESEERGLL